MAELEATMVEKRPLSPEEDEARKDAIYAGLKALGETNHPWKTILAIVATFTAVAAIESFF